MNRSKNGATITVITMMEAPETTEKIVECAADCKGCMVMTRSSHIITDKREAKEFALYVTSRNPCDGMMCIGAIIK